MVIQIHSDTNAVGLVLSPIGQAHAMAVVSRQPVQEPSGIVSELWVMATKVFPAGVDYRTVEDYVGTYCAAFDFQKATMKMVVPEVTYCGKETVMAIRKRRLRMAVYPVLLSTGKVAGTMDDIATLPWGILLNKTARVLIEKRLKVSSASVEGAKQLEEELSRVTYALANPTKPVHPDRVEEEPTRDPLATAVMLGLWGVEEHGPKGGPMSRKRAHVAERYNPLGRR